jgi:hypothetical protein
MANATWRIAGMFAGACWWSPGLTVILCTCCRRLEASRRHVGREAERPTRRTPRDTLEQLGSGRRSRWATQPAGCSPSSCWIAATGAVGVAINSAPPRACLLRRCRNQIDLPGAADGRTQEGCGLHPRAVAYAFTNTFTEEESRALYERYHIPASMRALWGRALATVEPATRTPSSTTTTTTGLRCCSSPAASDHLMPPASNAPTPSTRSPTP